MAASTCSQSPCVAAERARSPRPDRARSSWSSRSSRRPRTAAGPRRGPRRSSAVERVGAHRVGVVVRHEPHVRAAEAGEQRRLLDRAVAVARGVDRQRLRLGLQAAARHAEARRPLARAQQRDQRAGGGGVLDDAAASASARPDHLPQPVGRHFLELGERRARLPGQAEHAEARAQVVAEHARQRGRWPGSSRRSSDAASASGPGRMSRSTSARIRSNASGSVAATREGAL